jgi:hypothetical protein
MNRLIPVRWELPDSVVKIVANALSVDLSSRGLELNFATVRVENDGGVKVLSEIRFRRYNG